MEPTAQRPSSAPSAPPMVPRQPTDGMGRTQVAIQSWVRQQTPRLWWKVALAGIIAWVVVNTVTAGEGDAPLLALDLLLGASLMPFCFLLYWYEECREAPLPSTLLGLSIVAGGSVGLVSGALIEGAINLGNTWPGAVLIGVAEEAAKGLAILLIARYAYTQVPRRLHGLLVGVAVGAGFAAVETLGYGLNTFIQVIQQADFSTALSYANNELLTRMVLSPYGHVVWAGILGAAIWRERTSNQWVLDKSVVQAFILVVALHALWDGSLFANWWSIGVGDLQLPVFDTLIVGPFGLITLAFFVVEARATDRPGVPQPVPPLFEALRDYYQRLGEYVGLLHRRAPAGLVMPSGSYTPTYRAPHARGTTTTDALPSVPPTSAPSTAQPSQPPRPAPATPVIPAAPVVPDAPVAAPAMAAYCSNCGTKALPQAKFCANCGHALTPKKQQ